MRSDTLTDSRLVPNDVLEEIEPSKVSNENNNLSVGKHFFLWSVGGGRAVTIVLVPQQNLNPHFLVTTR